MVKQSQGFNWGPAGALDGMGGSSCPAQGGRLRRRSGRPPLQRMPCSSQQGSTCFQRNNSPLWGSWHWQLLPASVAAPAQSLLGHGAERSGPHAIPALHPHHCRSHAPRCRHQLLRLDGRQAQGRAAAVRRAAARGRRAPRLLPGSQRSALVIVVWNKHAVLCVALLMSHALISSWPAPDPTSRGSEQQVSCWRERGNTASCPAAGPSRASSPADIRHRFALSQPSLHCSACVPLQAALPEVEQALLLVQWVFYRLAPASTAGELPKGDDGSYGTSITLYKAMDVSQDVILAYKQNGRLLTPDHGFPLRCVLPLHGPLWGMQRCRLVGCRL
jgi:hypothetical protein